MVEKVVDDPIRLSGSELAAILEEDFDRDLINIDQTDSREGKASMATVLKLDSALRHSISKDSESAEFRSSVQRQTSTRNAIKGDEGGHIMSGTQIQRSKTMMND